MKIHISRKARNLLSVAPAVALGAAAILAETASAASNPCFDPTLEVFAQSVGGASASKGSATAKLKWKKPYIIEGAGAAQGFLSLDSGAIDSRSSSGMSRFFTPTCPGWSYSWSAKGTVCGVIRAKAGKATCGSALAACSYAGCVAGDVNPAARDSKTATNSASGGSSVSLNVGVSGSGPGFGLGVTTGAQEITTSTNSAGDTNTLLGGPTTNVGAGSETLCTGSFYAYITVQANGGGTGGSASPDVSKSSASAGGFVGGVVEQELYARSPAGALIGMGVHVQSRMWRMLYWDPKGLKWTRGVWNPDFGTDFEANGPEFVDVDDPPLPPSPDSRTSDGDGWKTH